MDEQSNRIGAIVLAAGASRRMGSNKALLPIDGKPMLLGIVESLAAISPALAPIEIVTGHDPDAIIALLSKLRYRVEFVHNADFETGMLSSVKAGLSALRGRCDGCLLMLGDQPSVQGATIESLISHWKSSHSQIVRPIFRGKHGHPILLAERCIAPILALSADATLNQFVATAHVIDVVVEDASTTLDLDTPDDYRAAINRSTK